LENGVLGKNPGGGDPARNEVHKAHLTTVYLEKGRRTDAVVWASASLSNSAEPVDVGLYSPERQLKLIWRDESNGWWKDVISRWVLQRKNEDEFQTLTFTSAFEFGETHRDLHLPLEDPVRTREIDLPDLAILANLDDGADVSRHPSAGRKQSLSWELQRLHARRNCSGGRCLSRQNRSSDQCRTEPGQQTLP
jgi:hypothetical protein